MVVSVCSMLKYTSFLYDTLEILYLYLSLETSYKEIDVVIPLALWSLPGWLQRHQPLGGLAEFCPHPGAQQEATPWDISHQVRSGCVDREEAAAASLSGRHSPETEREKKKAEISTAGEYHYSNYIRMIHEPLPVPPVAPYTGAAADSCNAGQSGHQLSLSQFLR